MIRILLAWGLILLTNLVVIMIASRVDFIRRIFIEGVSPFAK